MSWSVCFSPADFAGYGVVRSLVGDVDHAQRAVVSSSRNRDEGNESDNNHQEKYTYGVPQGMGLFGGWPRSGVALRPFPSLSNLQKKYFQTLQKELCKYYEAVNK